MADQARIAREDFDALLQRARSLANQAGRRMLGLTGPPGAGKSTLAREIVDALAPHAALAPMDGFHLAQAQLRRLGSAERKGAIDTFDAGGFVALLRRLRAADEPVVYAPEFRREIEEPIACAIDIPRDTPLVVTEGNYLLVADGEWAEVRGLVDEIWYLDPDERLRLDRLIARHMAFGRDADQARARAHGSDQRNADLIARGRSRADVLVI